jgi:hypothetical protein
LTASASLDVGAALTARPLASHGIIGPPLSQAWHKPVSDQRIG